LGTVEVFVATVTNIFYQ